MDKEAYLENITSRLRKLFEASRAGYQIAEIDRHRLEGFMQAGIFMEILSPAGMSALLDKVHYSVFNQTILERKAEKSQRWSEVEITYGQYDLPTYLR